mgnify:CR=1 FL=1
MRQQSSTGSETDAWINSDVLQRIGFVALITLFSAVFGEAYSAIFYGTENDDLYQGGRTGATIGLLTSLFEVFYVRSMRKSWIRRLAFLPGLVVRILIITFIVRLALVGNEAITQMVRGQPIGLDREVGGEIRDTVISLGLVLFFLVQFQFTSIIGFKRFSNLLAGRYFKPVEEDRVFVFIDLIGSSSAARQLGDVRFHEYLADFFHQMDRAIVRNGGEIVSYVGDAVIITWPLSDQPEKNSACLKTVVMMTQMLKRQSDYFEKEYGLVPEFRAALHGGHVVVGECGDSRRQITFLGDVVNMTARIEDVSKVTEERYIISDALAQRIVPPKDVSYGELGVFELKGSGESFKLHALRFHSEP